MHRPGRPPSPDSHPRLRPLKAILGRRRRACRHLGLAVPREIAHGPAETLAFRVATLDRWIARELDRAGGIRLPLPGDTVEDELDEEIVDDPDERDEWEGRDGPEERSGGAAGPRGGSS